MKSWGYRDYVNSIKSDVAEGLGGLGYDFGQSVLFAYYSLELKLENCPDEEIFALTALLVCIIERGALSLYMPEDEIPFKFVKCCENGKVEVASRELDGAELAEFLTDLARVKAAMGM